MIYQAVVDEFNVFQGFICVEANSKRKVKKALAKKAYELGVKVYGFFFPSSNWQRGNC